MAVKGGGTLHVNHAYCLDRALGFVKDRPGARVLDYGCGAGATIIAGRRAGLEIYGCEVFYEGGSYREDARRSGMLGSAIRELRDGRIDFPDATFDIVISNQVFEHVENLDSVVDEVARVLTPGGRFLSLFPDASVIREGHCGIPFVHWFPAGSRTRYYYALALRHLGLGYHTDGKTKQEWTANFLKWLDTYTFYRRRREIIRSFERRFIVNLLEDDYIRFRLERASAGAGLSRLIVMPGIRALAREAFRRLGFLVISGIRR